MPLLDIKNLSVEFTTRAGTFRAVDGIDLTVDEGEVVGIVGESGSGKSVTSLAVMGLLGSNGRVVVPSKSSRTMRSPGLKAGSPSAIR